MLWENVRSSSVAFRICKMIVNFKSWFWRSSFELAKFCLLVQLKMQNFISLIPCESHFFFPTQTLYNTHQNILHNIHNLHEDRRKFRQTFKDDDNRRMPFRISSSKNDVLTKKSFAAAADIWSRVCIFSSFCKKN